MFDAAFKAIGDLASPEFRSVLLKAVGLTLLLFALAFAGVQILLWFLTLVPWPWLDTLLSIAAGLGLFVLFFFLAAPVTALFAGLFLDGVAEKVERRHYPRDPPGRPLATLMAIRLALQFGLLVLAINVLALPLVLTGVGAIVLLVINAYLLSREYFEMVAMRHMPPDDAKALRKDNGAGVFLAGFLPAVMVLVPFVNLLVPLFATSYFTHIFKQVRAS
jgi:CysZ protein